MGRRVFVIAGEFSAHPRLAELGDVDELREHRAYQTGDPAFANAFFRYPRNAAGWQEQWSRSQPVDLADLLASATYRALCSFHDALGEADYADTLARITDLRVTSMPDIATGQIISPALIPQMLRAQLRLPFDARCQFVVGTSDSGAWAFASAVRMARERKATVLLGAGQMIPSGYSAVRAIRAVLGKADQAAGLDMLGVGDFLMDTLRRTQSTLSHNEVTAALAEIRERKLAASAAYPAAMLSGQEPKTPLALTPYFAAGDIAPACCGAAAVILTSDEQLAKQLAKRTLERYGKPPIIEVLGVGEGTSNPNVTHRRSPLTFGAPIAQALAAAARDASMDLSVYPNASFGVLHDAFPSVELAFLLGMGLSLDEALDRMAGVWSNPFGGLCAFGHAIGASGLVQICNVFHRFTGDVRYSRQPPAKGELAHSASVGGPLSHIVVSIFKGHAEEMGALATARIPMRAQDVSVEQQDRRRALREAAADWRKAIARAGDEEYIEGLTQVDLRSCLMAITPKQVEALRVGLENVVQPAFFDPANEALHTALLHLRKAVRLGRAELVAGYDETLAALATHWRESGWVVVPEGADTQAMDARTVRRIKRRLRVPLAIVSEPPSKKSPAPARRVVVLPAREPFEAADFLIERAREATPQTDPELQRRLPWWHIRYTEE